MLFIVHERFFIFRTLLFFYFCFLTLMLLHPDPWTLFGFPPMVINIASHFSLLHCSVFAALSLGTEILRKKYSAIFWLVALLFFGFLSEVIQNFTGRVFEYIDLFQNSLGLFCGFFLACSLKNKPWIVALFGLSCEKTTSETIDSENA